MNSVVQCISTFGYYLSGLKLFLISSSSITHEVGVETKKETKTKHCVSYRSFTGNIKFTHFKYLNSHTVNAMLGQNLIFLEENAEETKTSFTDWF